MDKKNKSDLKKRKTEKRKSLSNDKSRRDEDLDEEMEEIFHPVSEHFCIADLSCDGDVDGRIHLNESDYDLHRRESFQYHQPLRKLYHHKHRKSSNKKNVDETIPTMSKVPEEPATGHSTEKEESLEDPLIVIESNDSSQAKPLMSSNENQDEKVQFYFGSSASLENTAASASVLNKKDKIFETPLRSVLRGCGLPYDSSLSNDSSKVPKKSDMESTLESSLDTIATHSVEDSCTFDLSKPKVKFSLGEESRSDLQSDFRSDLQSDLRNDFHSDLRNDIKKNLSESSKHGSHRQSKRQQVKRTSRGFEAKKYAIVLEPEEAETLQSADIDDMASHRFEDPKGIRRHKIQDKASVASFFNLKKDEAGLLLQPFSRKTFDHEPHELFVELHELQVSELSNEWRETARWIKYEEDAELGPDRWGKPHVPPLSFHSLLKLRQCLESGSVLLDVEEKDFFGIAQRIVDSMVQNDQIESDMKEIVLRTLMLRHHHVNEKFLPMRRNSSGYGNLSMLNHEKNRSLIFNKSIKNKHENENNHREDDHEASPSAAETVVLMPSDNNHTNAEIVPPKAKAVTHDKSHAYGILRRVPENAEGAAVLVGNLESLDGPITAFVRLGEGTQMKSLLEVPINVRFIIVLLGPTDVTIDYHEVGRSMGSLMNNMDFHDSAYKASNRKDFLHAINNFLDMSTVVPPGKWERQSLLPIDEIRRKSLIPPRHLKEQDEADKPPVYDPLKRTGRIFGGFIKDIRNRYPLYWSDIKDSFNFQCVAAIIFIYFAAVSGAIAFGGLLSEKTGQNIGVTETLLGTSACGILFTLLAGQPLIVIGTTAPLVLIDETLYQYQEYYSSEYLVIRSWVGMWIAAIAIILVAAEGSILVKFFSRFVQEIFATTIALIFIYESIYKVIKIFNENPILVNYGGTSFNESDMILSNMTNITHSTISKHSPQPNTALLSLILTLGTFYLAYTLRHVRNSKFFGRRIRRALGDFGVPIAIFIMVLVDYFLPAYTEKLMVPEGLSPSTNRSWIISPLPVKAWEVAGAFAVAILVFILIFLETQIVELILCKKKLKKGSGFHLDMVIVGLLNAVSGFIGGPWLCAACVRSITHASSLTVYSKTHAPGETPHIIDIKEQRITNLMVSFLVGASILMAPLLRQVPFCVLFGVFLYMGVSSLSGIHLYERCLLFLMPPKHYPDYPFVHKVNKAKMHLYTCMQLACIAFVWVVKELATLAFPFALLSMVFVHALIKRIYTAEEMKALDEEGEVSEEEDEPDFYEQMVV